jgi:hypothetical protein
MIRNKRVILFIIVAILVTVLAACSVLLPQAETSPAESQVSGGPTLAGTPLIPASQPTLALPGATTGQAKVESIEIKVLETVPVQIDVIARGTLPDSCTQIDMSTVQRAGNIYTATVTTKRDTIASCTNSSTPFERTIPLDVLNVPAGLYTVSVNGVIGTFEFAMDNTAPQQPDATQSAGTNNEAISGVVWHDLCANTGGAGDAGCILALDGSLRANGILESGEPGLEGIQVSLGNGVCPASGFATVTTDFEGKYSFSNLAPGTYCVSVDETSNQNGTKLVPGIWTFPALDTGNQELTVTSGENNSNVNFGWDFQNPQSVATNPTATVSSGTTSVSTITPTSVVQPTVVTGSCTDRAAFVSDVTIPENSGFQGGTNIVKTWRIRNVGTCTWQTGYALIFVAGDQMGGTSPTAITGNVPPNGTVDISVKLTTPALNGTYRGEWKVRNANGVQFGIGENADRPVAVQIVVTALGGSTAASGTPEADQQMLQDLGNPTWVDTFDNAANWTLINNDYTTWEIKNGSLSITGLQAGDIDRWGMSKHPPVKDFYLEIKAKTGGKCRAFDAYGVIIRAPDSDAGYVFGFSCNGEYRLYKWDGIDFKGIQGFTPSKYIHTGPFAANRLGIMARGDSLKLYANGQLLGEFNDPYYTEGMFGLYIGPLYTAKFRVVIDEIALWEFK